MNIKVRPSRVREISELFAEDNSIERIFNFQNRPLKW